MQSEAQIDLSNSPLSIVSFRLYVSLPLLSHVPSPLPCSPGASSADTVTSDKASSEGSQEAKAAGEGAEVQGPKVTLANGELCVCVCVCMNVYIQCHWKVMCGRAILYSSPPSLSSLSLHLIFPPPFSPAPPPHCPFSPTGAVIHLPATYSLDTISGYYYDSSTGLYYDPNSGVSGELDQTPLSSFVDNINQSERNNFNQHVKLSS